MSDFKQLSRSVKGLTVLVTGAASGMGRATALVFAAEGANVAVTDINAEATQAVAGEITANGGSAKAWTLDVAKPQDIIKVVNDVAAHFGSLDIVINNAGISVRVRDRRRWLRRRLGQGAGRDADRASTHHPRCAAASCAGRSARASSISHRPRRSAPPQPYSAYSAAKGGVDRA